MPIVRVSGVPKSILPEDMGELRRLIQTTVMSIEELRISDLDWTVVYFLAKHPMFDM